MNKYCVIIALLVCIISLLGGTTVLAEEDNGDKTLSSYSIDANSGIVIESNRENERHQIASMVKIMALNIIFEEIDDGRLDFDDKVSISHQASSQGGSQLFLDANNEYKVYDLIKGMVVVSANDATYAMAEKIANNEDNFVKLMNDKAKQWNLTNTHFVNCTGLPQEGQYSSAKDATIMMQHLISHSDYFAFSKIWLEDFKHPSGRLTTLTNTNKLVKFYDGCDGGKTGFTNDAGFCLSATAQRGDLRVISTVLGCQTSKERFKKVSDTFNRAFNDFEYRTIKSASDSIDNDIRVNKGKIKTIEIGLKTDVKALIDKNNADKYTLKYALSNEINAPISIGDTVGKCEVYINGKHTYDVDIVSKVNIKKSSIFDDFINIAKR